MDDDNSDYTATDGNTTLGLERDPDAYIPGKRDHPLIANTFAELDDNLPRLTQSNASIITVSLIGILLTSYMVIYGFVAPFARGRHTVLFLGLALVIYYVEDILSYEWEGEPRDFLYIGSAVLLLAGSIVGTAYFFYMYNEIAGRVLRYETYEYYLAMVLVLAVLEAGRRAYGIMLVIVAYLALIYAYYGFLIPGRWGHRGFDLFRITEVSVLRLEGIFGSIPAIGATWVAVFILFAGLIRAYGGMVFIRDVATAAAGRFQSGVPQIAVITSMFMGSITGSAAANTAATGSFTIPLMKRAGIKNESAAAIESVASSGGQMLPPVMGAAAFLMAEFLGVSFANIIIWGLLPSLLFYVCISMVVTVIASRQNINAPETGITRQEGVLMLFQGGHFVVSIVLLIYILVVLRYDPLTAGVYAMVTLIVSAFITAIGATIYNSGSLLNSVMDTTKKTLHGFVIGARDTAPIMVILGPIALIVDMVTLTGLNLELSLVMTAYGHTLPALLFIAAVMSILFGLGMPTVAAYTLVVIFVVPGLLEMGLAQNYGHFFVFYFAVLSGITPPVAIAIAVAAKIADADFTKTCLAAIPVAIPGFIIPFAFIYNRSIIEWSILTPIEFFVTLTGVFAVSVGLLGYLYKTDFTIVGRAAIIGIGLTAIFVPWISVKLLLVAIIVVFALNSSPFITTFLPKRLTDRI